MPREEVRTSFAFDGYGDVMKVELLALLHVLELAWNKDFRNVCCEVDNLEVEKIINSRECPQLHQHAGLSMQIFYLAYRSWSLSISHAYREANEVAHFLASVGVHQTQPFDIWDNPSLALETILLKDSLG